MFPSFPRKQLEKEVTQSKSRGERREDLIERLLLVDVGSSPIDLTGLGEEEDDVEVVENPGTVKYKMLPNSTILLKSSI